MQSTANTHDLIKSVLPSGPKGLGTKTANIAANLKRPGQVPDAGQSQRLPYLNDEAPGVGADEKALRLPQSKGSNPANTPDTVKSVLSSGPKGMGTRSTNIAAFLNRRGQKPDAEMRHRLPNGNNEKPPAAPNESFIKPVDSRRSDNTLDLIKSILSSGPRGLGTKTTNVAAIINRPDHESDTELRHRLPYRNDEALGEELNDRLLVWAESIGLYDGHLDYLRKCNFGRYVMLTYAFSEDRERLFMAGQAMLALFGLDDYFVDDKRAGSTLDMVGRNLSLCMSALDEPFFTEQYNEDTDRGLSAHPVHIALREYIAKTAKFGTPQQVARVRHEDMCLFVAMCQESSWRVNKMIAPVWEYLGGRQMNGFTPCLTMIDIVDAYELPHNIYSLPQVRQVVKIAGLICVMVNDLVSTEKEAEAGVHQFGIREAIQNELGCTFDEAHKMGIRLHNDLLRIFEDESSKLMVYATPDLRRYLIGLEAWIAGSHRWHTTSDRYSGK